MTGEEFLNEIYKDLKLSPEVLHTASGTKDKDEAVKRYMDRLEKIHIDASKKEYLVERLKHLYHKKYVVKENDIPKYRDKEKIIKAQKEKLDAWVDFLLDENTKYPMWAKYWVFQGMLKMGNYNEATETYQKRSKKTLTPFIDVNSGAVSKCINVAINYIKGSFDIDDELKDLIESKNFSKLYTYFLKEEKKILSTIKDAQDGIWVTYHYETEEEADLKEKNGIEPEYKKLYKSIKGYNTGWCTADSLEEAKDQICGIDAYSGGDFYVYYTKDLNDQYKIPRVAIRMEESDIGEIRGIEAKENVEDGFEEIIEKKLKTMSGLTQETIKENLEKINDMKYLTLLNQKTARNEEFTEEDIIFIYQLHRNIKCFGLGLDLNDESDDPRIVQILNKRNPKYDGNILTRKKDKVKFFVEQMPDISEEYKNDRDLMLAVVKKYPEGFEYIYDIYNDDKEIVLETLKKGYAVYLRDVSERLKYDRDVVLAAIKLDVFALEYVPEELLKKDKTIILEAVKKDIFALKYISPELYENDKEIKEILITVLKKRPSFLYNDIFNNLRNDKNFIIEAIRKKALCFDNIPSQFIEDRDIILELLKIGDSFYIPNKLRQDEEFFLQAIKEDEELFETAEPKLQKNKELILKMVEYSPKILEHVILDFIKEEEFMLDAIKINDFAFLYADGTLKIDKNFILKAVKTAKNPNIILLSINMKSFEKDKKFLEELSNILNEKITNQHIEQDYYNDSTSNKKR